MPLTGFQGPRQSSFFLRPLTPTHPTALTWKTAVEGAGGAVSDLQLYSASTFLTTLHNTEILALFVELWFQWTDDQVCARVGLIKGTVGSFVGSPVWTSKAGVAYDGVSQYCNTGYTMRGVGLASLSNCRVAVREAVNVTSAGYAGGVSVAGSANYTRPRSANNATGTAQSGGGTWGPLSPIDSRGLIGVQRNGSASVADVIMRQNGVDLPVVTAPSALQTVDVPNMPIYLGCFNNSGTAGNFRPTTLGYVSVGRALTNVQSAIERDAVTAYIANLGVTVS